MTAVPRGAAARLASGQEGMTVVEVVVAGMILVIGSLGVLGMVDGATRSTFRAEQSQVVSNVLQREMEKIRELPYDEIGLSSAPSHESGSNEPNSRITGSAFYSKRNGTGLKSLVLEGAVAPGPEPFQVENVKGQVYRYVVWDVCPESTCNDGEYLKRAIVAVKLETTASGGVDRRYQEIQSQIVDPEAAPSENSVTAPSGGSVTPWWLWLTDTTCDRSEPQTPLERSEVGALFGQPEGDHPAHNTRGVCADGLKVENEPGAPDLLWPEAPVLIEEEDPEKESESPVYDYATDVEPLVEPDRDKGLQILLGGQCGAMPATEVRSEPDSDGTMFQQLHKWITPPVKSTSNLALTGEGALYLWTQSIEHGVYPVTVCIWLFTREGGEDTPIAQTFEGLPYTTYSKATWPSTGWSEIVVPLSFNTGETGEIPLPEGSRIGVAISVQAGEHTSGIQTLYDEPSFDSRLSLDTVGELPEWP